MQLKMYLLSKRISINGNKETFSQDKENIIRGLMYNQKTIWAKKTLTDFFYESLKNLHLLAVQPSQETCLCHLF